MNLGSIIILLIFAALLYLAYRHIRKKGPCGQCGKCKGQCQCHSSHKE